MNWKCSQDGWKFPRRRKGTESGQSMEGSGKMKGTKWKIKFATYFLPTWRGNKACSDRISNTSFLSFSTHSLLSFGPCCLPDYFVRKESVPSPGLASDVSDSLMQAFLMSIVFIYQNSFSSSTYENSSLSMPIAPVAPTQSVLRDRWHQITFPCGY
jgi:hypothetical protein